MHECLCLDTPTRAGCTPPKPGELERSRKSIADPTQTRMHHPSKRPLSTPQPTSQTSSPARPLVLGSSRTGARRRARLLRDAPAARASQAACKSIPSSSALAKPALTQAPGEHHTSVVPGCCLMRLHDDLRAPLQTHLSAEIDALLKLETDRDSVALFYMWRTLERKSR